MNQITEQEYSCQIREIVAEVFNEAREQDREPLEILSEMIDGHEWVIYTHYNMQVLMHSANGDYCLENFGSESLVIDGNINWCGLAYGAMYGDCMDTHLPDGLDWNEIPEQEEANG